MKQKPKYKGTERRCKGATTTKNDEEVLSLPEMEKHVMTHAKYSDTDDRVHWKCQRQNRKEVTAEAEEKKQKKL